MPMLDSFNPLPTLVLVRFQRWNEILKLPQPDARLPMTRGIYHYARGLAFAHGGNAAQAQAEIAALKQVAPEMSKVPTKAQGPRNASIIPQIAAEIVQARIAQTQNNGPAAVEHLQWAVLLQDSMDYNEPPDWFYPVRESLGAALLRNGDAVQAEKVFRDDLERNPRNGRSLFGLMQALMSQGRNEDARSVEQQFQSAWKNADTQLSISQL
jgi:tetratricopeptide (TPR) repeat protein